MPDLSRCNLCGAVLRVVQYPGWGNEPVKHECRPVDLCRQGMRLMAQADAAERADKHGVTTASVLRSWAMRGATRRPKKDDQLNARGTTPGADTNNNTH